MGKYTQYGVLYNGVVSLPHVSKPFKVVYLKVRFLKIPRVAGSFGMEEHVGRAEVLRRSAASHRCGSHGFILRLVLAWRKQYGDHHREHETEGTRSLPFLVRSLAVYERGMW